MSLFLRRGSWAHKSDAAAEITIPSQFMPFFKMRVIFNDVGKEARSEAAMSDACPWCGFRKQQNKQAKSLKCKPCFTTAPLYSASSVIRFSSSLRTPRLPERLTRPLI